jgi:trans-aconitate methyltransferase
MLVEGALDADVGCGHGASTTILVAAYPRSRFISFDHHEATIVQPRATAERAGLGDRFRFEVASASAYPGAGYDL